MKLENKKILSESKVEKLSLELNEAYYEDITPKATEALKKLESLYNDFSKMSKNGEYGITSFEYYREHFDFVIKFLSKFIKEYDSGITETLEENDTGAEEDKHAVPTETMTPDENGIQSMLQFLIKDEWDAIEGYNGTIQTLKDMGGYDELVGMLQEIANEEYVHVGQLQKGSEMVNPSAKKITDGENEAEEQLSSDTELSESKSVIKEGISWSYYDSPKYSKINDEFLPDSGEGDTMASQLITAVNKLVYKWYNDGDVFDTTTMNPGMNDLSSYANWLYKNIPESKKMLDGVFNCNFDNDDEYSKVLARVASRLFSEDIIDKYKVLKKTGTIYNCDGPFKVEFSQEDDEYDW